MRSISGLFAARPRRPRSGRPLWSRVARLILAVILLDLLLVAIGLAAGGYELIAAQQSLGGVGPGSGVGTGTGTNSLSSQARSLRDHTSIASIGLGLARLCWWPWRPLSDALAAVVPPARAVAQVGPLLDIAASGSAAAVHALDGALPALSALQGGQGAGGGGATDPGARLLAGFTQGQNALRTALADVTTAERDAAKLNTAALPGALRTRLDPALRLLPLADASLRAALAAPDLLGATRPRLYLLVPENPLDLRATGGFVGTVALVQADHGRLTLVGQQSSTDVDDGNKNNRKSYIPPPLPLLTYQHLANWFYRDANWSPDFPTTAALLRYFYGLGQPQHIDGVIAFDSSLVPALLRITGPITVTDPNPPHDIVTLTADNAVATLQARVNNAGTGARNKPFASTVYSAVFKHLRALHGSQLTLAARVMRTALDGRHLLLWVPDPSVAPLLARQRWDGAIDPTRADYLYVVDTNVHYNKINNHVQEGLSYQAVVTADRSLRATLAITYTNGTTAQNIVKPENNTLYEDFVRVYVPLGSRLLATSGLTQVWAPRRDHDKTVFAGYLRVPSLASATVTFSYIVPPNTLLDSTTYSLTVQKQPGRADLPFQANLRGDASGVRVGAAAGPGSWAYQGRLNADLRLTTALQGGQARPLPLAYDAAPLTIGPGVAPDPWSVLPAALPPPH